MKTTVVEGKLVENFIIYYTFLLVSFLVPINLTFASEPDWIDADLHPSLCKDVKIFHLANSKHAVLWDGLPSKIVTYFSPLPKNVYLNPSGAQNFDWTLKHSCGWVPGRKSNTYQNNGIDYDRNEIWNAIGKKTFQNSFTLTSAFDLTKLSHQSITNPYDLPDEKAYFVLPDLQNNPTYSRLSLTPANTPERLPFSPSFLTSFKKRISIKAMN
jgi:hypothetical protein